MKLRAPPSRSGLVRRTRLLEEIGKGTVPVTMVVAPAGFGKTTLLEQMGNVPGHGAAAWLTLDHTDSDPSVLLNGIAEALVHSGAASQDTVDATARVDPLTAGVGAVIRGLGDSPDVTLYLDQVDHLGTTLSNDLVAEMLTRATQGFRLVVATRNDDGLPLGSIRSRGELREFGVSELALDDEEASRVLEAVGLDPDRHLATIMAKTEGWPAGVYLAALAIRDGASESLGGDDVYLVDYLRQELLDPVPEERRLFLIKTSILERMSGPLCDHVLQADDSSQVLDQLARANLLIAPLDRTRTWYRYHSLLREYLLAELKRDRSDEVSGLHTRAAAWFENEGMIEHAVSHARNGGDVERVARLTSSWVRPFYASGRVETGLSWFDALEEAGVMYQHPELAGLGGFARALDGDAAGAERFSRFALNDQQGIPIERDQLGPHASLFRSYLAAWGPENALEDAQRSLRLFAASAPDFIPTSLGAMALATQAIHDLETAEVHWTDGLWRGEALEAGPFSSAARAARALAAIDRDDWEAAGELTDEAMAHITGSRLEGYATSSLAFTVAARIAARKGDVAGAMDRIAQAGALRPRLTVALPMWSVLSLHEMARAYVEVGDVAGARRVMRDAADILALRPRLGSFVDDHESLRATLSTLPAGQVGASSLTRAELRLLPLLVTHLTYPELGDRLFVSRHTIKTQAMSIYRKLGVSSRAEAVDKAREAGLISV